MTPAPSPATEKGDSMRHEARKVVRRNRAFDSAGFTLLEVVVAATLILILFFGLAQIYTRGRAQIDMEESRRKATALVQSRLEGIRSDFTFDTLTGVGNADGQTVVDNRSFQISHTATPLPSGEEAATVTVVVSWVVPVNGGVTRSVSGTTVLARGMP